MVSLFSGQTGESRGWSRQWWPTHCLIKKHTHTKKKQRKKINRDER